MTFSSVWISVLGFPGSFSHSPLPASRCPTPTSFMVPMRFLFIFRFWFVFCRPFLLCRAHQPHRLRVSFIEMLTRAYILCDTMKFHRCIHFGWIILRSTEAIDFVGCRGGVCTGKHFWNVEMCHMNLIRAPLLTNRRDTWEISRATQNSKRF